MALVEDSFCESEMYCVNNTHVCSCAVVSKNRNPAAVTPAFFNLFCPPFFNAASSPSSIPPLETTPARPIARSPWTRAS